ncbi:MAG: tetratricopeptide repeat protein [Gammaproteobacteria bacterium]
MSTTGIYRHINSGNHSYLSIESVLKKCLSLLKNRYTTQAANISVVMVICLALCACSPDVPESDLPPLPVVDTQSMVPTVAEQIDTALSQAQKSPGSARKTGHLGMVLRAYNLYAPAEAALHRASLLAPRNNDWQYYHSEVLYELGLNEQARSILGSLSERKPKDLSVLLLAAKNAVALGETERSLELVDRILARESLPEAWVLRATLEQQSGKSESAIESLHQALTVNGPFSSGHYRLAMLYRQSGQQQKSHQHLILSSVHTGKRVRPYFGHMAKLLVLNISDRPLLTRAQTLKGAGDLAGSLELLEEAVSINPGRIDTRTGLVLGYAALGDVNNAEKHMLLAEQERPEFGPVFYARGRLELARKQLLPSIDALQQAVERSPNHADAHAWLGYALKLQSKEQESAEHLKKAIAIKAKHPVARHYYAEWLIRSGDLNKAATELESMTQATLPDTAKLLALLSGLYEQTGQVQKATATLERGIELATAYDDLKILGKLKERRARLTLKLKDDNG